jgi:hypothetical protein
VNDDHLDFAIIIVRSSNSLLDLVTFFQCSFVPLMHFVSTFFDASWDVYGII